MSHVTPRKFNGDFRPDYAGTSRGSQRGSAQDHETNHRGQKKKRGRRNADAKPKPRRAAALALALTFASMTFAFVEVAQSGEGATCKSRSGFVAHSGTDGSSCDANSDGSSTAHAVANANSYASSAVLTGGNASAVAKGNSISTSTANSGGHSTSRALNSGGVFCFRRKLLLAIQEGFDPVHRPRHIVGFPHKVIDQVR